MNREDIILKSWNRNADAWSKTIADAAIESRKLATDRAVIEAVSTCNPGNVLDLGCGEGWLIRALQTQLPQTSFTGLDAVPGLISRATELSGNAHFEVCSYQDLIKKSFAPSKPFDLVVINFALFGNELVSELLISLHSLIGITGKLVIQTLHPYVSNGDGPYEDGWREGSWSGFSSDFTDPAPWYFRKMESWLMLFKKTGYHLEELREPIHPVSGFPASVIFILSRPGKV
ncbi:class I SAM-dependent methyltransferase [Flavihumibacter solisilvae]|uniref:Methyltransferase domain-containing protein n=1 Tax=Flavihumibacter solisilvae TaxID=1349421 RepID=A0A0C1LLY9_9BACT|nr:class I SAM-dependent methyltransferase [Flavihumibacter solisilvae]KIC96353.1 hypothetical protein OI18_00935 [Flavihumibacter solisilvae]